MDPASLQEKMKTFKFAKVDKALIHQAEPSSAIKDVNWFKKI